MVLDIAEPAAGEDGHARRTLRVALRLAEERPGIAARTLGDAETVLAGIALRGFVRDARQHLEDVAQDQAHGATDGAVGAIAGSEQVHIRVHADLVGVGTAHDQQWRRTAGAGGRAMEIELRPVHRLEGRDQHGKIFRQASGHDGIDGGCMQGKVEAGRGMMRDHRVGWACVGREHRLHAVDDRRDDGQAVGPALLVAKIDGGQQVVRHLMDAG